MSDTDSTIEAVAEAIWRAHTFAQPHVLLVDMAGVARDSYRRMAQAAIDALGLQTEWGWQLGDNTPSVYPTEQQARDRVTYLDSAFQIGTKRHIVHRYTTPWTREDTG